MESFLNHLDSTSFCAGATNAVLTGMLRPHPSSFLRVIVLGALLTLGCSAGPARPTAVASNLPAYTAEEAALFDDSFSPELLGMRYGEERQSPEKLEARTRRADTVSPVKVATVNRESVGEQHRYHLILKPRGPALAGVNLDQEVDVFVGPTNPAFAFLRSVEAKLVGKDMVVFLRRYQEEGDVIVHFRGEPDNEKVRAAVKRAATLGELD